MPARGLAAKGTGAAGSTASTFTGSAASTGGSSGLTGGIGGGAGGGGGGGAADLGALGMHWIRVSVTIGAAGGRVQVFRIQTSLRNPACQALRCGTTGFELQGFPQQVRCRIAIGIHDSPSAIQQPVHQNRADNDVARIELVCLP